MFNLFLGTKSEKFIKNLEAETRTRIWEKLDQLKLNPFPSDVVRIVGKKLKSFRVRVGKYRIQYIVIQEKKEIVIFDINKRERAYD